MLTYPESTMRIRRMPMHLSSGHMTDAGKILPSPSNFPQSDLGHRADSRWASPQISNYYYSYYYSCQIMVQVQKMQQMQTGKMNGQS